MASFSEYRAGQRRSQAESNGDEVQNHIPEIADVTEIAAKYGGPPKTIRTGTQMKQNQTANSKFSDHALVLRRRVKPERPELEPQKTLEIWSPKLQEWFRCVAVKCTAVNLFQNPIQIEDPFAEIYHYREAVAQAIHSENTPEDLKVEIKLLQAFQAQFMSLSIKGVSEVTAKQCITFEWLWALFPPGETVILQNQRAESTSVYMCAVVESYTTIKFRDGPTFWKLTVVHFGFDGSEFGKVRREHVYESFSTITEIQSLPVYPLSYHRNAKDMQEKLIERGRTYVYLCEQSGKSSSNGTHWEYEGPIWTSICTTDPNREYSPNAKKEDKSGGFYNIPDTYVSLSRLKVDKY